MSDVRERGGVGAGTDGGAGAEKHAGGRRPGETRTREAILTAARTCFADRGFDATSLRRIAETAGVDQALVHHFYGTKENLFIQALELPGMMREAIASAARGGIEGVGVRLVRAHMSVWDDVSARPALMTMVRSAAIHQAAAAQLRDTATAILADALSEVITGEDVGLRASLIATQLVGLALMRYVLALEPLASVDAETVARHYGPALQAVAEGGTGT
ncbi:TetR family transcriptional regulator [Streptomyces sp. NBC_01089]|uniref:TetR/AcrR family transcriptional regulator n=1 Tax=Streptomyces sp. NBC_01089 TaxID=2903747 RepID=UPI00387022D9|nr:TetR family transcriptional regulator [Streptomyces sp. NBC_01089]